MTAKPFYRDRTNRCMAGAIALIALLMQALAGYLPMPAMGGLTSWQIAWTPMCLSPQGEAERGQPADRSHGTHCAVCVVMSQAGSTDTPAEVALAAHAIVADVAREAVRTIQIAGIPARAFSSRAPPFIA
jgi:hypothetical protein